MTDNKVLTKLYKIDYNSKERQKLMNEIRRNNSADRHVADEIFKRKFKFRGVHAKVEEYTVGDNLIILAPNTPDCGVDKVRVTFEEFADQVEFL